MACGRSAQEESAQLRIPGRVIQGLPLALGGESRLRHQEPARIEPAGFAVLAFVDRACRSANPRAEVETLDADVGILGPVASRCFLVLLESQRSGWPSDRLDLRCMLTIPAARAS